MVVCHCEALNDRQIRAEVRAGCESAVSVMISCRAGTRCGGCRPLVAEVVADELSRCAVGASAQVA